MANIDKELQELQAEMQRIGAYRYIRMGVKMLLQRLDEYQFIPKKPKVSADKRMTEKQNLDMWFRTICDNCLQDTYFMEKFLLGEKLVPFWSTTNEKNKQYKQLELVPESKTKTITIKTE